MFTYEQIISEPSLLDNYKLSNHVEIKCSGCGNSYLRQKRHIIRSLNNTNGLFCSIKCSPKSNPPIELKCENCDDIFSRKPSAINHNTKQFCCLPCANSYNVKARGHGSVVVKCDWCSAPTKRKLSRIKKFNNTFCSRSCLSKSNLKNMQGKRSKIEIYLENKIVLNHNELDAIFNDRKILGYELDILIPSLNIAFELNGPYHYKPIRGFDKLNKTIHNDIIKKLRCEQRGIQLFVIDICWMRSDDKTANEKCYQIVKNIIEEEIKKRS